MKVPAVLLSGDHRKIEAWKRAEALKLTRASRPDLLGREDAAIPSRHNEERPTA